MKIRLIRHATMLVLYNGRSLLVDPMFSREGEMLPVQNSPNPRPNPLVPLPVDPEQLKAADAVLLTHTHRDHFDDAAAGLLPKEITVFCQPPDEQRLKKLGFSRICPVEDQMEWLGTSLTRTGGRHGTGEMGQKMGPVSGFVLQAPEEPSLYIAGDTVWCPEVEQVLAAHRPRVAVVYAGAAQFLTGGPIIMTAEDVGRVCRSAPGTRVVAAHMEAFNHCLLTRRELAVFLEKEGLRQQVHIPDDGEWMEFV